MKRTLKIGAILLAAVVMAVFTTSSAMALILSSRSAQMVADSPCDRAGSIEIKFEEVDYSIIRNYLDDVNTPLLNNANRVAGDDYDGVPIEDIYVNTERAINGTGGYILIKATLGGEETTAGADPLLCKDIICDGSADDAAGEEIPLDLVRLDHMGIEVSDNSNNDFVGEGADVMADMIPDVTAYVFGTTGSDTFYIYVTDIQVARDWDDQGTLPWIKVGLIDDVDTVLANHFIDPQYDAPDWNLDQDNDTDGCDTKICVDVRYFVDLSILDVSYDFEPNTLQVNISDNQIGHFTGIDFDIEECQKTDRRGCEFYMDPGDDESGYDTVTQIELCEPADQDDIFFYNCLIVDGDGDFQKLDEFKFIVTASPADVVWIDAIEVYAGNTNIVDRMDWDYSALYMADTDDDFDGVTLGAEELTFCIRYTLQDDAWDEATAGTPIQFMVTMDETVSDPCGGGEYSTDWLMLATLADCGQLDSCMYFPYVLGPDSNWTSGIVISNISDDVAVADMDVEVSVYQQDSDTPLTGTLSQEVLANHGKIYSASVGQLLTDLGLEASSEKMWVKVKSNFDMDGWSFTVGNGGMSFGAGTLPRLLEDCDDMSSAK